VPALRKALELNPGLTEARLMLGNELYQSRSYAQALITLREVRNIQGDRAASVFLVMAECALQLKMEDDARKYAQEAQKYARQPFEIDRAQRLMAYLNRNDSVASPEAAAPPQAAADTGRPTLRHRDSDSLPAQSQAPPNLAMTARGRLTQLDCLDGMARLHVNSEGITYSLLIRKPNGVVIRNNFGAAVDIKCGPQNTAVTVEYNFVRDDQYGTTGDVQSLEFVEP